MTEDGVDRIEEAEDSEEIECMVDHGTSTAVIADSAVKAREASPTAPHK